MLNTKFRGNPFLGFGEVDILRVKAFIISTQEDSE